METISAREIDRYIFDKNYLLVDVRNPSEYRKQHIRGAVCVPREYLIQRVRGFGKIIPVLYCDRGGLSMQAARELEEETGYHAGEIKWLITIRTTVAFCNEKIDIYVATDLTPGSQHLDEDEYINVEAMTVDELCDKIFAGEIEDSKTISAIMSYRAKYGSK